MRGLRFFTSILAASIVSSLSSQELILQPSISPDGDEIAFSYQGDIWKVPSSGGRADRLTIHESYDGNPIWVQDQLAFQSDRFGNNDLYTIPSDGGIPKRLTHHSASDGLYSASGDQLYFTTNRLYKAVERESELYQVDINGGTPTRFMDALGFDPVVSPDGNKVAFVRGTCRIAREAYVGPADRDVWVWDRTTDAYAKITSYEGNDYAPRWLDDNTLLYITSKSGKYNVHQINLDGSGDTQLTSESDWGVNSFSVSPQAGRIAYQYGSEVATMEIASRTKNVLSIDVSSDYRFDPVVDKTESNRISEYDVSPDGSLIAYTVRGEIFVRRNDKEEKRSVRLTTTSDRERGVEWLNDEALLFVSDKNGQNDLFILTSADPEEKNLFQTLKHKVTVLKETDEEEFSPQVSPDGTKLAFRRGRGKLVVASISSEGKLSNEKILQDGWDTPQGISWSPDSKWLAYGLADLNFNQEVYIHDAENRSAPVNVSLHPKYDGSPVWSADGSKLGFVSQRNNSDRDIWFVWLQKSDWEVSNEKRKRESLAAEDNKKKDKEGEEDVLIEIDFDGIYKRLEQVTRYAGNESEFLFDKKENISITR